MLTEPRNIRIDGVELNYAKVDPARPVVNPFNKDEMMWELQIATTDPAKAQEMREAFLNVKEKDGKFIASVKRKTKKKSGEDNGPVRVVDANLSPFNDVRTIGNGSVGNVILFQYPWSNAGRSGVSSSLTAMQITTHEVYTPSTGVEFDAVGGGSVAPTAAPAANPEDAEATLASPF